MDPATTAAPGLALSTPATGGITIAELSGNLDIACAPALREQLLGLLRPGASRLVIELSKVSHCDASGLAVLIGTGRRARLLGGFLRLAAVSPQVDQGLHITGLRPHLGVFPTVHAAAASPQGPAAQRTQRRQCARSTHSGGLTIGRNRSSHRQPDQPPCFFRPSPGMMTHATR
jgi:anti-anti-sigma factor